MIGKSGKEGNNSKKSMTNDSINTSTGSDNDFPFDNFHEKQAYKFEAKHQILSSVEDIQHFMQPHLPLSNSINLSCSTDACVNDAKDDRFIRDKSAFYTRQFRHISASSNITHPKCCFFKINTVSIINALMTGALLLSFMVYIIANHISTASNNNKFSLRMAYSMIAISVMALIFIGLFIGGISRQQKNCMLPLILLMIFSCVGLFGMFVIMITMTADNTNKRFTKYSTAANIITTRISLLVLLTFSMLATICYIRSYWFISLMHREKLFLQFPVNSLPRNFLK